MRRLLVGIGALGLLVPHAFALDVLIAQGKVDFKRGDADPNVLVADFLADELYKGGKMSPVLWSMGDPIFRAAVTEKLLKNPANQPTLKQAQDAQRLLKTQYLLYVTAIQRNNQVEGQAVLYKNGKIEWSDKQSAGLTGKNGFDLVGSVQALASTWASLINVGPLKGTVKTTVIKNPTPEPGAYTPPPADPTPKPAPKSDWSKDIDAARKEGRLTAAIGLARAAVDAKPEDVERRKLLVEILLQAGEPVLAASEARRATKLVPGDAGLRLLAAKAWLESGNGEEAQLDLNEIVARNPKDVDPLLMAQANLFQLKLTPALDILDQAIQTKPNAELYLFRSLARALQADPGGAGQDVAKVDVAPSSDCYFMAMTLLDKSANNISAQIRQLVESAPRQTPAEAKDGVAFQTQRAQSTRDILVKLKHDSRFDRSHERRLLAYNLLAQALADIGDYFKSHDDEALNDARISLAEAAKHFNALRDALASEYRGEAKVERTGSD